jgi:pimeloyl-ACP methyl ester carboxylesterase
MITPQDDSTQPERAETTPTRFVNAGAVSFAYRRFGNPAGTPLVLLQHFRGSMDNWDPALLNGFARDRTVITFDNAGVGFSSGDVPDTVAAMAQDALAFLDAFGLTRVDLLGFSLGGYIAQHLTLQHPQRVRRLILTGPVRATARAPRTSIRRSWKRRLGLPPETACCGSSSSRAQGARQRGRPSGAAANAGRRARSVSCGPGCAGTTHGLDPLGSGRGRLLPPAARTAAPGAGRGREP